MSGPLSCPAYVRRRRSRLAGRGSTLAGRPEGVSSDLDRLPPAYGLPTRPLVVVIANSGVDRQSVCWEYRSSWNACALGYEFRRDRRPRKEQGPGSAGPRAYASPPPKLATRRVAPSGDGGSRSGGSVTIAAAVPRSSRRIGAPSRERPRCRRPSSRRRIRARMSWDTPRHDEDDERRDRE